LTAAGRQKVGQIKSSFENKVPAFDGFDYLLDRLRISLGRRSARKHCSFRRLLVGLLTGPTCLNGPPDPATRQLAKKPLICNQ
jgi:hypothetical protein